MSDVARVAVLATVTAKVAVDFLPVALLRTVGVVATALALVLTPVVVARVLRRRPR